MRTLTELRRTVAQFLNGVPVAILLRRSSYRYVPGMVVGPVLPLVVQGLAIAVAAWGRK